VDPALHFARPVRSILVLLVVVAGVGGWVIYDLPEGDARAEGPVVRSQQVESISIDGRGLPLAELRSSMGTKLGATVDTAQLGRDKLALQKTLAARGYLAAKVSDPIVTFGPTGGVYIIVDIERGPLYRIRNVTLVGPAWRDAGVVTLAAGDEAEAERLSRARQAAEDTLVRHGKALHVELELTRDKVEPMVDVRLVTR
jgi:outer membrane protein assembly factor BamA